MKGRKQTMANFVLSAFADEVSPVFDEQLKYLKKQNIGYIEPRNIDGTNVSSLTLEQAKEAKAKMDKNGIGVSSIGSPIGKINVVTDDFYEHFKEFKLFFEVHRNHKSLVSVAQVNRAPYRSFVNAVLFCPLHFTDRRIEILFCVLCGVFHVVFPFALW